MKTLRFISLMLVIVISAMLLGACNKGDTSDSVSSSAMITVVKDGVSDFSVIKPANYSKVEWNGALSIVKNYKAKTVFAQIVYCPV